MKKLRYVPKNYNGVSIAFQWFYIIAFPVISFEGKWSNLDEIISNTYFRIFFWLVVFSSVGWCLFCTFVSLFLRDKFVPSFNFHFDSILLKSKMDAEDAITDVMNNDDTVITASSFNSQSFQVKVSLLLQTLAVVIEKTIPKLSISDSDIFISVYFSDNFLSNSEFSGRLNYLAHYPPSRDVVFSKKIDILDGKYVGYECSKCLMEGDILRVQLNPGQYVKTNERAKTVKNYFGYPIKCREDIVGFLNIEIHNKIVFKKEDEARDYAWKVLNSHKILLEEFFVNMSLYINLHERCKSCKAS